VSRGRPAAPVHPEVDLLLKRVRCYASDQTVVLVVGVAAAAPAPLVIRDYSWSVGVALAPSCPDDCDGLPNRCTTSTSQQQ
jgi:hypothetical protein